MNLVILGVEEHYNYQWNSIWDFLQWITMLYHLKSVCILKKFFEYCSLLWDLIIMYLWVCSQINKSENVSFDQTLFGCFLAFLKNIKCINYTNCIKAGILDRNMHSILIYALTLQICIYMHYKSFIIKLCQKSPYYVIRLPTNFRTYIQNRRDIQ